VRLSWGRPINQIVILEDVSKSCKLNCQKTTVTVGKKVEETNIVLGQTHKLNYLAVITEDVLKPCKLDCQMATTTVDKIRNP